MNPSEPQPLPRILIVDDSTVVRTMFPDYLRRKYTVDTAKDFNEAAAAIQAQRPDGVLLDLNFKGGSASDVIQLIRQYHGPSVAIIGMSGDVGKLNAAVQGGLFEFHIVKPPTTDDQLLEVVANALETTAQLNEVPGPAEAGAMFDPGGDDDELIPASEAAEPLDPFNAPARSPIPPSVAVRRAHELLEGGGPLAASKQTRADELMALRDTPTSFETEEDSLASLLLRHPSVVRSIEEALDQILPSTPPLMRVPAGVASLGTVLRWLLNQIGAARYEVAISHQEGLVIVYVWDGQVIGIASDAWPQDDRVEAVRGLVLPAPDDDDSIRAQREMLEWAGANGSWLEVRRQAPLKAAPIWAVAQPSAFHELTSVALTLSGRVE